jgi:hypothetical protein
MKSIHLLILIPVLFTAQAQSSVTSDSTQLNTSEKTNQQNTLQHQKAFTTEASYTGDICTNMFGGIATGIKYLGMAN